MTLQQWADCLKLLPGYDCYRDARDCWFDHNAANTAVRFFETRLRHMKGEKKGQLIKLEMWQKAVLGAVFGWKKPDGTRRYREVFLYIPRKNGKTIFLAGIAVMLLVIGKEGGQEIYSAASETKQAKIAHDMAKSMVYQDVEITKRCKVYKDSIVSSNNEHVYTVLSAEAYSKHGFNASCILVDELHAHPNGELIDVLETSMNARKEPLIIYATTADYDRPSVCNKILEYARDVRDGVYQDKTFLPVLYMADENDDWEDEKTWYKANPNLGVSFDIEALRIHYRRAKRVTSDQNKFRRLYLNQRTQQVNRWIDLGEWDDCSGLRDGETPEEWRDRIIEAAQGLECWGGLDLGATSDLTAMTLLFDGEALGYDNAVVMLPWAWCPSDSIDAKDEKNQRLYWELVKRGFMMTTPGNVADYRFIREDINSIASEFKVEELAADRLFQGAQLCTELREEDGINVIDFGQGFLSMAAPVKDFEERIKGKRLIHGANPLLRWQAGNANTKEDPAGNLKPVKPGRNSSQKIDNIVCAIMALARYNIRMTEGGVSRYNNPNNRLLII